jgi:iron complex outermembrane receptor protein
VLCLILLAPAAAAAGGDDAPSSGRDAGKSPEGRKSFVDSLFWAPEILVEAARISPEEDIMSRSGFSALVNLTSRRHRLEDAASILSRSVGVRVRRYGGLGSFATMSIRGSSSSQVQFYLDGVPLNDPYTGLTDLSDISTSDLDRIEIYRGTSPTGFGGSSIGGTVNLVSAGRGGSAGVEAHGSAGSFGTMRINGSGRIPDGPLSLRVGAGYLKSEGDFPFVDDNGTPENPGDDGESFRLNNDFTRWNASGRLGAAARGFDDLSLNFTVVSRESGIPGIGSNQSSLARSKRERRIGYLKVRPSPLAGRKVHLDGTAFYSWTADRFSDPGGEIGLLRQSTDNRIVSKGANVRSRFFVPAANLSIEGLLEGRRESFVPRDLLPRPSEGPERKRDAATASASAELGMAGGRLFISGGVRYGWSRSEFYDDPPFPWLPPVEHGPVERSETTPSAGFRMMPVSWLTLKGNWGKHYRLPSFYEMFGNSGTVTGTPGLEPEQGSNMDIGIVCAGDRLLGIERPRFEAAYLESEMTGLILFFQNSQHTVKPRNIGSASIRGYELSASGLASKLLRISMNYTWLDSKDTSPIPYYNGNELPGRPRHEASLGTEVFRKRWSVTWEFHYIGSNYLDRANLVLSEERKIHDLILVLRSPDRGITLSLEGRNLGDERIHDVSGFPLPGRTFFATIGYSN